MKEDATITEKTILLGKTMTRALKEKTRQILSQNNKNIIV